MALEPAILSLRRVLPHNPSYSALSSYLSAVGLILPIPTAIVPHSSSPAADLNDEGTWASSPFWKNIPSIVLPTSCQACFI